MKVDRLVSIIMILLEKRRVGAQELAAMFEVSPRTVYRDMEAINQAGIPVLSVPGVGGGFEIMPGYKVDRKAFSADDLSALLMGLNSLSGVMRGDEFTHALAKVRSFIPAEQARAIELKASQVVIDPRPWMGGGHIARHLDTIKEALQQSRLLSFTYTDGHETARSSRFSSCSKAITGMCMPSARRSASRRTVRSTTWWTTRSSSGITTTTCS